MNLAPCFLSHSNSCLVSPSLLWRIRDIRRPLGPLVNPGTQQRNLFFGQWRVFVARFERWHLHLWHDASREADHRTVVAGSRQDRHIRFSGACGRLCVGQQPVGAEIGGFDGQLQRLEK